MRKRTISLLLAVVMLISIALPMQAFGATSLTITSNGETVESVTLPKYDNVVLTAAGTDNYQWQIKAGDSWANISGETGASIKLTYAMVASLLSDNSVLVRCRDAADENIYSPEVKVTVDDTAPKFSAGQESSTEPVILQEAQGEANITPPEAAAEEAPGLEEAEGSDAASPAMALPAPQGDDPELKNYVVEVKYQFEDGKQAATSWTATVAAGSSLNTVVTSPVIQGYKADKPEVKFDLTDIRANVTEVVTYKPAMVNYTVKHLWQNTEDDNYTVKETETKTGLTGETVPDNLAKKDGEYEGFISLLYDPEIKIAADGSTVVEIHYDRVYSLMLFDLSGGYGVEPIYARYGAAIENVGTPVRAGYTFTGWNPELPTTMPLKNTTYTAQWRADDVAKVSIVIWGENADDTDYSYVKTSEVYLKPGTEFTYSPDGNLICAIPEHTHSADCGYACGQEEHVHNDTCYVCGQYSHAHGKDCYAGVGREAELGSIGRPKNPKEGQVDSGIADTYIYIKGTWYHYNGNTPDGSVAPTICGKTEQTHTHTDECLGCGKVAHTHSDACGYLCGKTAHQHTDDCYMGDAGMDNALWTFERSDTVTVAADGSTVVDVYYKRTQKTLDFYYNYKQEGWSGNYQKRETITAKWGADISEQYKDIANNAGSTFWTERWDGEGPYTNYIGIMPHENMTYYHRSDNGERGTMTYWGQDQNGRYTVKLFEVSGVGGYNVTVEDHYEFKGFTYDHGTDIGDDCAGAEFYYTRNSYQLEFNDGYDVVKRETVKYEQPLSEFSSYTPQVPSAYEPGSVEFGGWYLNPECSGNEFKLDGKKMPAGNMILYAKWRSNTLVKYTIHYVDEEGNPVAEDTTGNALAGTTKTFDAKAGAELFGPYQEGYFPTTNSHSIEFKLDSAKPEDYTFVYVKKESVPYTVVYKDRATGEKLLDDKTADSTSAIVTENYVPVSGYMPEDFQIRLVLDADEADKNVITFWYNKDDKHALIKVIHYTQNIVGEGYTMYQTLPDEVGVIGEDFSTDVLTIPGFNFDHATANGNPVEASDSTVTETLTEEGLLLELYYNRNEYPYEFRHLRQGTKEQLAEPDTGTARYQATVQGEPKNDIPGYHVTKNETKTITIQMEDGETAEKNVETFYYMENHATIQYKAVGPEGENFGSVSLDSEVVDVLTDTALGSTPTAADGYRFVGWYKDAACTDSVDKNWVDDNNHVTPGKTKKYGDEWGYTDMTLYAKFERADAYLTITTKGTNTKADPNQGHVFQVAVQPDDAKIPAFTFEVAICEDDSETFKVPYGTYTVTEIGAWDWRYADHGKPVVTRPQRDEVSGKMKATAEFDYSERPFWKWLNGCFFWNS